MDHLTISSHLHRQTPAFGRSRLARRAGIGLLATTGMLIGGQLPLAAAAPPAPPVGLWAMSSSNDALTLSRSILQTDGLVHSEGGIALNRTKGRLTGGTEYASTFTKNTKIKIQPAIQRITPGLGNPAVPAIADYRPGGAAATSASSYTAIDPSRCVGGYWTPERRATYSGVVYVPCGLALTGSKQRTLDATFVAEGKIMIWAQKLTVGPAAGGPSLVSGAVGAQAILLTGAKVTARGQIIAPEGTVNIASAAAVLQCGVQAQAISATRAAVKVPLLPRCSG